MAVLSPDRILALQVLYNISGNKLTSTLHYFASASLALGDAKLFLDDWETDVLPTWQAAVSEDVTFDCLRAFCVGPEICKPATNQLSSTDGTVVGVAVPETLGVVIRINQYEVTSRRNNRIYVAGATEDQVVDSLLSTAAATGVWKDLADKLIEQRNNGSGTNFDLCTYNVITPGAPNIYGGYDASACFVTRSLCTQRRRRVELNSFMP